ncbi:MAG: thioredoxin domain-containing protein, partial [Acidocella sp. 20-61-6]
ALGYAHRQNPLYAARARETVAWLTRDMREEGAYAASEDADSEGVEGKFYVWTAAEIRDVLGEDAAFFGQHYDLPEHGNWEERIILERKTELADEATERRLAECRARLLARRAARIRPGRDDKILADWNALTVAALARASAVFGEPGWLAEAQSVFDFILARMGGADGRIAHAYRAGRISAAGLLDDQAAMLRAALALYEATGEAARLDQCLRILAGAETHFSDGDGAFYVAADDAVDVPGPRGRNAADGPTPSGLGLMAENYARLYALTGAEIYRAKAQAVLAAFGGRPDLLGSSPVLLAAADHLANASCVVVTGGAEALAQAALAAPDPAVAVLRAAAGAALPAGHPAHGKAGNASAEPAAFICRGGTCALPLHTAEDLRAGLRQLTET